MGYAGERPFRPALARFLEARQCPSVACGARAALRRSRVMANQPGTDLILAQMERELVPPQKVKVPAGLVYHYTDAVGLDGILRHAVVHATHYRFMNDRTELDEGRRVVLEACNQLVTGGGLAEGPTAIVKDFARSFADPAVQSVTRDIFIASFSERGDDLGQWRAYGNRGAGYAIGIKFTVGSPEDEPLDKLLGVLLPCEYNREKALADFKGDLLDAVNIIKRYAETYMSQTGIEEMWKRAMVLALRRLGRHWLSIKSEHFRDEAEWRFIGLPGPKTRKEHIKTKASLTRGTIPYVELPLTHAKPPLEVEEIIVGPTHDPESGVLAVTLLLESLGYDRERAESIVKPSKVPFRG